jgi:beta-lactamase class A
MLLSLVLTAIVAQTPQEALGERFEQTVESLAQRVDGIVGVTIIDLATDESFSVHGDVVFTQASAIKLPILVELFRQVEAGEHDLEEIIALQPSDITPGSGVLQQLTAGSVSMTLRDVATLMITVSDNTATNMIIDRVGMENVNATMARLGLSHTKLQRKMMDTEAWLADRENLSTPNEQARLLVKLHRGEVLSDASREELLRILSIPKSSRIRAQLPPGTRVAHKTGSVPGVVVDVGIVYLEDRPFVVAAMANWLTDAEDAERAIAEISLAAHQHFDRLQNSNSYGHRK